MNRANCPNVNKHKLLVNRLNLNMVGINEDLLIHAFGLPPAASRKEEFENDLTNATVLADPTNDARLRVSYAVQQKVRLLRLVE